MMGQKLKPLEEILGYLKDKRKVVLMGCGGCATLFRTGGEAEVDEMAKKLSEAGKEVLAKIKLPMDVYACFLPMSSKYLRKNIDAIRNCDALIAFYCGDGVQVTRGFLEELGIFKPIYPAVDSLGFFGGGPTRFIEECQGCGECILAYTGGICPLTRCPKGLLNGPCGGVRSNGKCEVNPDMDCAWVKIYEWLEKLGETHSFKNLLEAKDWSKMKRPRVIEVPRIKLTL